MVRKKMDPRYKNYEDATRRLHDGIVYYKSQPYWGYVQPDMTVVLCLIASGEKSGIVLHANDEELDISTPELGYVNPSLEHENNPYFVYRAPWRKQKQAAAHDNLLYQAHGDITDRGLAKHSVMTKEFYNMLINSYPNYEEAMKTWELHGIGSAISRNFAVFNKSLWFNNTKIGERKNIDVGYKLKPEYINSIFYTRLTELKVPIDQHV